MGAAITVLEEISVQSALGERCKAGSRSGVTFVQTPKSNPYSIPILGEPERAHRTTAGARLIPNQKTSSNRARK